MQFYSICRVLKLVSSVAGVALLGLTASARADLNIVPVFDSSITSDTNAAAIEGTINSVIGTLDSYLANPVTVTITFGESDSGLGNSSVGAATEDYSTYLSALETQQNLSPVDTEALASLGQTAPYSGTVPATNPVNGSTTIKVAVPLLEALGQNFGPATGTMVFNASIVNDSRTGSLVIGDYDLQSVVNHELDEILGIGGPASVLNSGNLTGPVGQLDLFRYSAPGVRSFTASSSASSYFSIDGGVTDLVHFNQSGDGTADYSDWGNGDTTDAGGGNTPPQVQDAYGSSYGGPSDPNEPNLGSTELTAFDAVGWDLTPAGKAVEAGAVPEPSIYSMMFGGFALLAFCVRRKLA